MRANWAAYCDNLTHPRSASAFCRRGLSLLAFLLPSFFVISQAHAQPTLTVDCTGATPGAFTTINAAINAAPQNSTILVTGPCNEDVVVNSHGQVALKANNGQTVNLTGSLNFLPNSDSSATGFNVTNTGNTAGGNGIYINGAWAELHSCSATGNRQNGLFITNGGVTIYGPGSFNSNGNSGIQAGMNSSVFLHSDPGTALDFSNNSQNGIQVGQLAYLYHDAALTVSGNGQAGVNIGSHGSFGEGGPLTIKKNGTSGYGPGLNIAQYSTMWSGGPLVIENNQNGGIAVNEHSSFQIWGSGNIQQNGPVGIEVNYNSNIFLWGVLNITQHSGPAIDVAYNSRLEAYNSTFSQNGSGGTNDGAVRVSYNSSALLNNDSITSNLGSGILATTLSTVTITGDSISGNSEGIIRCDNSSFMSTDLTSPPDLRQEACTMLTMQDGRPVQPPPARGRGGHGPPWLR